MRLGYDPVMHRKVKGLKKKLLVASLFLVAMPFAPSSVLYGERACLYRVEAITIGVFLSSSMWWEKQMTVCCGEPCLEATKLIRECCMFGHVWLALDMFG